MTPILPWLIWILAAYLAGSIPFGLIISRTRGVDIRQHGSGNVGATNVGRVLGIRWGFLCFGLDVAKGLAPVLAYSMVVRPLEPGGAVAALQWLGVAAAPMIGHVFPLWLGFRGGKGVATGLGVVLGLWPILTLPAVVAGLLWVLTAKLTGYVSLASIAAAVSLPPLAIAAGVYYGLSLAELAVFLGVTGLLAALVVFRHRSNLANLRAGTEPRARWTGRASPPTPAPPHPPG
jgi:glycerol-3-phosphate acyltransferase PlsY